jgi:hypothetical protein
MTEQKEVLVTRSQSQTLNIEDRDGSRNRSTPVQSRTRHDQNLTARHQGGSIRKTATQVTTESDFHEFLSPSQLSTSMKMDQKTTQPPPVTPAAFASSDRLDENNTGLDSISPETERKQIR